ncbi:response regulator transcription factor [Simiduia aestuariiviva]|uniref:Two-component system response regulator CpxR n=1 Tax=Simiduia aestuariiviva TaxID=1510459 RepID=A0A839UL78_9GAMM|nr:response regulator transcription factor [Simiduia aestuariiviva]MBB3168592.1 two-component system response regulator CpxR [Simiduia aestuariiviva]
MHSLLLVDDDRELCDLLASYLGTEGFGVTCRHNGRDAAALLRERSFSLIVLDVMMPELNGMDLLKQLREQDATPVLMLTAKGDPVDRILGLELGADDYLAKPCNPRELLARIKAILRRSESPQPASKSLQVGALQLHAGNRTGFYGNEKLELTGAEYTVLSLLMAAAGEVLSKDTLTEQALGRKLTAYDRSIDVHVSNVRKKIHQAGGDKDLIINIRGAGYMLTQEQAQ